MSSTSVIVLNKPFKIRSFTMPQWIMLGATLVLSVSVAACIPRNWQVGNLSLASIAGLLVFWAGHLVVKTVGAKSARVWRYLQTVWRHPNATHAEIISDDPSKGALVLLNDGTYRKYLSLHSSGTPAGDRDSVRQSFVEFVESCQANLQIMIPSGLDRQAPGSGEQALEVLMVAASRRAYTHGEEQRAISVLQQFESSLDAACQSLAVRSTKLGNLDATRVRDFLQLLSDPAVPRKVQCSDKHSTIHYVETTSGGFSTTLCLAELPYAMSDWWLADLCKSLPAGCTTAIHIEMPDQKQVLRELERTYRFGMVASTQLATPDLEALEATRRAAAAIQDILRNSSKAFDVSIYIQIHAKTLDQLRSDYRAVESVCATAGAVVDRASLVQIAARTSATPFGVDILNMKHTIFAPVLSCLCPPID